MLFCMKEELGMQYKIKEMPLEELEPKVVEGLLEHKERLGYNIPKKRHRVYWLCGFK